MSKITVGKVLLTVTALYAGAGPYVFDWNKTHIHNPDWPPHAKFHNAQTMSLGAALCAAALTALWGRGRWTKGRLQVAAGAKTERDPAILDRADVFVEYTAQTRIEGEIQAQGPDFPVTELWEVILGTRSGRVSTDAITVFDSVGFAIEDFSALRYVRHDVAGTDLYTQIDLIAEPDGPKDLFGMVGSPVPVA